MRCSKLSVSPTRNSNPDTSAQTLRKFVLQFRRSLAEGSPVSPILARWGKVSAILAILAASTLAQTAAPDSSRSTGWVVISVSEYETLRAHAYPGEREPEPPPVDATLTRVDYDLHVLGELATGRASLTVDVLKDGWVRVPIPAGLLVREARLDGKLVSLVSNSSVKGGSQPAVVLSHAGRALLQLDIALAVNSSAGEERISLPSTNSGVTRAHVQLPRLGVDVRLTGGLLAEKSESAGESLWLAYARGNEPLTFTWHRKMEDHHITLPLRQRGGNSAHAARAPTRRSH